MTVEVTADRRQLRLKKRSPFFIRKK